MRLSVGIVIPLMNLIAGNRFRRTQIPWECPTLVSHFCDYTAAVLMNQRLIGTTWIDGPNWAGYITTKYNQSRTLLTYDYAVGGSTVKNVRKQIMEDYLSIRGAGHKPWYAPWTASDSLFGKPIYRISFHLFLLTGTWFEPSACFVGINDLK